MIRYAVSARVMGGDIIDEDLAINFDTLNQTPNSTSVRTTFGLNSNDQATMTESTALLFTLLIGWISTIVLMNQLIALMGDSYAHVMENLRVETLRARGSVAVELMYLYRPFYSRRHVLPRWLHVIRPVSDGASLMQESEWEGNLKAVRTSIGELKQEFKAQMESRIAVLTGQVEKKHNAVVGKMSMLDAKLERIMALLTPEGGNSEGKAYTTRKFTRVQTANPGSVTFKSAFVAVAGD